MATLQTLPEVTTILPAGTSAGVTSLAMRTFFYAVFKHTRLVVGTFLLIFVAAAVTAIVRPTIWMASTTVLVKLGETEQLRILQARMKSAQRRSRADLQREHVLDVDQEILLLNQAANLQDRQLREHRLKMVGVQQKLNQLRVEIAGSPVLMPYSKEYHANPTRQVFENQLAALEVERYKALQGYLPTDRHVQQLDDQIVNVKARVKQEQALLVSDEEQRSDLHTLLLRNKNGLEVLIADLRAREPGLRQQLRTTRRRLVRLRNMRLTIANLKADADEKAFAYDLYRKRSDQAQIQEAMTDQSMVNVAVVQHATPPIEPLNGMLLPLLLGLVGGIGLASGLAVAIEYVNRRLRFEEEVERYLELPVLAVIPDLETTAAIARA